MTNFINSIRKKLNKAAQINQSPAMNSRYVPAISEDEVAEAKSFFPLEKFFIFGHARSGTTMLTRLVRLHPDVCCNYQAHFFTRPPTLEGLVHSEQIGEWLSRPSNRWNRGRDLSPVILRAAADFILEREARREGKCIVGDKSPNNLLDGKAVTQLAKVYPDASLIYIVRDGRDAAISHRFQAFIDLTQHLSVDDLKIRSEFSSNPDSFLNGSRSIFTKQSLREAAEGWVRNVTQTDQQAKKLYREHYLSLKYENLLDHSWEELQRIWSFLGAISETVDLKEAVRKEMARNPDAEWQVQKAKEIADPIQKGKRGNWRSIMTAEDRHLFHSIAENTLQTWGYPLE
jgi:hypothetical protein